MPSFHWHERSDELNRVRQQGNGDHDAGKEGRIYAETANAPPDCPCDCDNDSHDHGREKKLHAVILAADSAQRKTPLGRGDSESCFLGHSRLFR
jgi:hypothetical protein